MSKFIFDIQRFAESGDASASADATAVPGADESVAEGGQTSPDDRAKQYSDFKTNFKAEFDAEVQNIVKDRLKNSSKQISELKGKEKSIAPILNHMAKQYNVDPSDYDALVKAFENDDKMLENEAIERGMTVEQLRSIRTFERENERLKADLEERNRQAVFAEWDRQSEDVKKFYPNFDPRAEMQNETFRRMMDAGVDMKTAYEFAHRDEHIADAMTVAAQKTAEKVTNSIKANANRPAENGLNSAAASVSKIDISNLSYEQLNDYIKRARQGEKITFRD